MPYDYPTTVNVTATDGLVNLFRYLNDATAHWFANMFLITIFLVFAGGFYAFRRDFQGSLAIGGFATFVIATLFWIAGIVGLATYIIVIGMAILGFLSLWVGDRN